MALLLARQGVDVTLLEAHTDLERDFRGDTLHSSTLELMHELGLVDRLLQIPHGKIEHFMLHTPDRVVPFRAPGDPGSRYPDMLRMPQSRFLEFLVDEAQQYPSFRLILGARVEALIEQDGVVRGVRYRDQTGWQEVRALLTVGADGRFSKIRQLLGFEAIGKSQPRDLLWFRLPRKASDPADADGIHVGHGLMMTVLGRATEWQIAFWVQKGGYQGQRAAGLQDLRQSVTTLLPWLADRIDGLQDWQQIAVLTVESSRVRRWYRPGVLLIGDAAHVMSPVGGVGINLSIQDAVAASNIVGPRLRTGMVRMRDLAAVQRHRELPTRLIQFMQDMTLRQVIAASQANGTREQRLPWRVRLAHRLPVVAAFRDRLFANGGFRPEHVRPRTNWIHVLMALLMFGVSSACAAPVPNVAPTSTRLVSVKVADPLNVSGAPIYLAQDQGYFRSEGLDVDLVAVSQTEVVQQVATGQLQFGMTLPSPFLFNALDRGIAVTIVASGIVNRENDRPAALMVRSDLIDVGVYRSASDLRGATIAAGPDASQFYVERYLHTGGLTRNDVNFENLSEMTEVLAAFANHSIAAAWLPEPFVTAAEKQGLARTVATTGQLFPGAATQTLIMAPSLQKDQPDVAVSFLRGYLLGLRAYYHAINKGDTDRGPVIKTLANHTPIKDANLYRVMGLPSMDPNGELDITSWNVFQDYFVERGLQHQKLDLGPYVDSAPRNAAVRSLGREP